MMMERGKEEARTMARIVSLSLLTCAHNMKQIAARGRGGRGWGGEAEPHPGALSDRSEVCGVFETARWTEVALSSYSL